MDPAGARFKDACIKLVGVCVVAVIVIAIVLMSVLRVDPMPLNATVLIDESGNYYSPPLAWRDERLFHIRVSSEYARENGLPGVVGDVLSDKQ